MVGSIVLIGEPTGYSSDDEGVIEKLKIKPAMPLKSNVALLELTLAHKERVQARLAALAIRQSSDYPDYLDQAYYPPVNNLRFY